MAGQSKRSHWPISILSSITSLINVFLPLVLVRILTKDEAGMFRVFFLYLSYLPAVALTTGLMSGLAYWSGQKDVRDRSLQVSSSLIVLLATLASLTLLATHTSVASSLGWDDTHALLFGAAAFGAIASYYFEEAAIATGRIWTGALFFAGFELLRTVSILVSVLVFRSVTALFVTHTIMVTLKAFAGLIHGYSLGLVRFTWDSGTIRSVISYALPVSLAWTFGMIAVSADQLVLSLALSKAEFALYAYCCLQIQPLYAYEQSVTRVLIPQLSEAFTNDRPSHAATLYREAIAHLALIMVPAVTGLVIFSEPIISILLTEEYASSAHYLRFFAFTYLFLVIPYDAVARSRGRSKWILSNFVKVSIIALLLTVLGAYMIGPLGALLALLLSGLLLRGNGVRFTLGETGWRHSEWFPWATVSRIAIICVSLGLACLLASPLFESDKTWFLVCGSLFALFYFPLTLALAPSATRDSSGPLSVLIVVQNLSIGGLERVVYHLCATLHARSDLTITVFAYDHDTESASLTPLFEEARIPLILYKKPRGFSLKVLWMILRRIITGEVKVLHCHDLGGLTYCALAKLLSFGRVKLVMTQHSFIHLGRHKKYEIYEKLFSRIADEITVVSEEIKTTYERLGLGRRELRFIPNGVAFTPPVVPREERLALRHTWYRDHEARHSALGEQLESLWILYLARLYPQKGQDHAMLLWRELPTDLRRRMSLLFVGPEAAVGEAARLHAMAAESPDADRIFFLGGSAHPQEWLRMSDIYLSCSESEGMPLGPLEAVGGGLPTVLSHIPGHEFLDRLALLFPLDTPARGASHIVELSHAILSEPDLFSRHWGQGQPLRDRYSLEEMGRQYAELYGTLR